MIGSLFETAVFSEIRKLMSTVSHKAQIYHWRLHSGAEVDFLLEKDGIIYPLEIKIKSRPAKKDTRGFKALREHYPQLKIAPGLVISPSERFEKLTEKDCIAPWDLI